MAIRTFTAARFGSVDSQGDILMPGCVKPESVVIINHNFDYTRNISVARDIKEENGELRVTADIPDKYLCCTPAIGYKVIRFERNNHGGNTLHEISLYTIGLSPNINADPSILSIKDQVNIETAKALSKPISEGASTMQSWLSEQVYELKEKTLREVMELCLGHQANTPDYQRFKIITHLEYPGREFIGFDGRMVGEIVYYSRQEGQQWKVGYEFIPKTKID